MKYCYIGVTPDKYELIMYMADSAAELSKTLGIPRNVIYQSVSRGNRVRGVNVKFLRIALDEEGDDDDC